MAMQRGPAVRLESARFAMATAEASTPVAPFQQWAADPKVMTPLNLPARSLSAERVRLYFESFDNRAKYLFVMQDRWNGRQIGFWICEFNPIHLTCAIHQVIGEARYWGLGVTQELGIVLIDWIFATGRVEKISLSVPEHHQQVVNLMNHIGWPLDGLFRAELKSAFDASRIGEYRFGLLAPEWPDVRQRLSEQLRRRRARTAPNSATA